MRNPLNKQYLREFKKDSFKYILIMIFLTIMIGTTSGQLVGAGSIDDNYHDGHIKYKLEDGQFILENKLPKKSIKKIQKKDVTIYNEFYKEKKEDNETTYRIYNIKDREKVNKCDILSGRFPKTTKEISIDRVYAKRNNLKIGDKIKINKRKYTITGFSAMVNYSALFKDNKSIVFDSIHFTPALVTDKEYKKIKLRNHYKYVWRNKNDLSKSKTNKLAEKLAKRIYKNMGMLSSIVHRYDNNAIRFAGDDFKKDTASLTYFMVIFLILLSLIFRASIKNNIQSDSKTIGTLRASGYSKSELRRHYLVIPLLVSLLGGILGNILGYTVVKDIITGLYYNSYSLMPYHTVWNAKALLLTTGAPLIIMFIINYITLILIMRNGPSNFLRNEIFKRHKAVPLKLSPKLRIFTRIKMRTILDNKSIYSLIIVGIIISNVLLIFGLSILPIVDKHAEKVKKNKIANYEYTLVQPVKTKDKKAEKFAIRELVGRNDETVTIYGISPKSKYLKNASIKRGEVLISNGYVEKFDIEKGDTLTFKQKYKSKKYKFKLTKTYEHPSFFAVFMDIRDFRKTFKEDKDYYNGYFSNRKLKDLKSKDIALTVTGKDLSALTEQMNEAMKGINTTFVFATLVIYMIMVFLLSKLVIEKNTTNISMTKVLGFHPKEINRLFNSPTRIVVIFGILISLPISTAIEQVVMISMIRKMDGWFTPYIPMKIYPLTFALFFVSFEIMSFILRRRTSKISLSSALNSPE